MKKIKYLLLLLLLIPMVVYAEGCDTSKITIDSISIEEQSTNTVELEDAKINGKEINVNLKFQDVGDSITYKVTVKNDSEEAYEIDENSFVINSEYIEYELLSDDNNSIVNAKEEKTFQLRIYYKEEVDATKFENGVYKDDQTMVLNLSNNNEEVVTNPITQNNRILVILTVLLVIQVILYFLWTNKKYAISILLLISLIGLPFTVKALCKCELKVSSHIEIVKTGTFRIRYVNCGERINGTFQFTEGMTIKEWIYSDYLNEHMDNLMEQNETPEEEKESYSNWYRTSLLEDIVTHITHDENYIIQEDDFLDYNSPFC